MALFTTILLSQAPKEARPFESLDVFKGAYKSLLQHVFRFLKISGDAVADIEHGPVILLVNVIVRPPVAIFASLYQFDMNISVGSLQLLLGYCSKDYPTS